MLTHLRDLGEFYYWPNDGNLGDLLIAEATRQYFRRNKLSWKEFDPLNLPEEQSYNLVYGGGGRFTSHYNNLEFHLERFTDSRVNKGVVLPHSFYQVDDFITKAFNENWVLYCREQQSYDYCRSLAGKAEVLNESDMGLALRLDELGDVHDIPDLPEFHTKEEALQAVRLEAGFFKRMCKCVKLATITSEYEGKEANITFLFRNDKENCKNYNSPVSFDISMEWESSCGASIYNRLYLKMMAVSLMDTEIVVTDRLHVGIMGFLLGKKIIFLDNDYKKISGVYRRSLAGEPNVVLLKSAVLPPEILSAWNKINTVSRRGARKIENRLWKLRRSIAKRKFRRKGII